MRCTRIEFNGYKRLADAACNLDGNITAFVGLNEAGKSSMLEALTWLTFARAALPVTDRNRSRPPSHEKAEVVRALFRLGDQDLEAIADLPLSSVGRTYFRSRRADGSWAHNFVERPTREPRPFDKASSALVAAEKRLNTSLRAAPAPGDEDEADEGPNEWLAEVLASLASFDDTWSESAVAATEHLQEWLAEVPKASRSTKARDARAAAALAHVLSLVRAKEHPRDIARQRLLKRMPSFVQFNDEDRVLETEHDLADENLRDDPSPALANLLDIAKVELNELWTHVDNGDSTRRATLLEEGNDRLGKFFEQAWNQAKVTVRLNVTGTTLELLIKERRSNGTGPVTRIDERSDGLKTFVALAAFLASGGHTVPPILLIDEAETHLHFDAQADLVGVLLKNVDANQVLYTTHSPGCLPSDLGTGIRLLSRDPAHHDASIIKSNFWQDDAPGFAPLLYAMGAGAAAFSVCRRAVLAEGASDMILLPTLIRIATKLPDLEYQVAPGLANAHGYGMRVEEVAAKVVYLTDGDDGGTEHAQMLRRMGVPANRIFSLPAGMAAEDLIHRDDYLRAVNAMLENMGQAKRVSAAALADGQPVSKSLKDWCKRERVRMPGKVEVAYELLQNPALRLTAKTSRALRQTHERFLVALDA